MQVNFFNVTQHGKIKATCFTCLICYAAFSDGKTNHKKINSAIRMSQLNIQFTHLHVEKTKKKYFFWQKKLTIFVADPNQMIGSNCCNKVPVTHLNTVNVLVSGF